METGTLRWLGILTGVIAAVAISIHAIGVERLEGVSEPPRADVIAIDTMVAYGKLERPPVVFLHDRHTEALAKKNQDCRTCHLQDGQYLSIHYKQTNEMAKKADGRTVMDLYHDNCIACHEETRAAGEKSGPVTCGDCHSGKSHVVSVRNPMDMDKSLHYRHIAGLDEKCETCHHEYDSTAKKLIYTKGKEENCRVCHGDEQVENRMPFRVAAHTSCIACHQTRLAEKKKAGPVQCSGCHDPLEQQMIAKLAVVPRLKRNQPDAVFVKTGDFGNPDTATRLRMNPVPFNHLAHEQFNDSCRVCHHAGLNSCSECHTIGGVEKGNFVKLEQAMHQLRSEQSCLGCHELQQRENACAGCHGFLARDRKKDLATCRTCHLTPPEGVSVDALQPDAGALALRLLEENKPPVVTYPQADIPEVVTISEIADRYEPAVFPHRKVVNALMAGIRDNRLANRFHDNPGMLCQGCHHNSPAAKKPPKCASCHGKPFDEKDLFKPGLSGAYHRQCMECHEAMALKKPDSRDCTACHAEKK